MKKSIAVRGFLLQESPPIYFLAIKGKWLLEHTTPSWRIKDPQKGFQRIVKEDRARKIAVAVLDQQRSLPNAIVLATDIKNFDIKNEMVVVDNKSKFLVVDGQHRLWAQKFSDFDAEYACLVHGGLNEEEMARLFLEINDNQKRVPSSLRWDLVRLVRPDDDPYSIKAADLIFELAEDKGSPLFQRIDLTGEQGELKLKQGSLAPELKSLVTNRNNKIRDLRYEDQYEIVKRYFTAIKALDSKGWSEGSNEFYQNRIIRVLIRLLPEIIKRGGIDPLKVTVANFNEHLGKIDQASISTDSIKAKQGGAGMTEIYEELKSQMFGKK
jgi:DNA sulfur modification protein DndB